MQYLKTYLNKIIERGNVKLAESVSKTAEEVGEQHIRDFSFTSHEILDCCLEMCSQAKLVKCLELCARQRTWGFQLSFC